ncbi:RNA pseudouridine synthase [Rubripirellula amarantea]|uniref:Ribosomal large subunit pseudouridine synthase A n=1 Tax=Rubripirellula amarantea TaxID=2527999 RepID=A0A5C5WS12_9BACT|nr:RNA pseudouridine synthase [Rubripirellula amarantea]MDA8745322.1 RNA pseudouridine synthase [Rubripirellula amarantea]TWT52572.1 Ribosomal large subunit pseudouridine synthase A [Rubripirellula amarantea]
MIPILQSEPTWIAVDKPAGLPTQAPPQFPSLENALKDQLKDQLGEHARYLAMPHRLDVPVSGVILVALTKKSARLLSEQFRARKVLKTYQAVVAGDATQIDAHWKDWIRKVDQQPRVERASESDPGAQLAETRVTRADFDTVTQTTRLTLNPLTGRMHQLRVGAAWRGFPINGDAIYGPSSDAGIPIALRAVSIEFHDPRSGKRVTVSADPLA